MILPYISNTIWLISVISLDNETMWPKMWPQNKYRSRWPIFNILMILLNIFKIIWAPSSEFVSSSILSWQILTAHAQPFRGARDLAFCQKVPLDSLLVWARREGSGETVLMRRLAWTFAARIGDKYQIHLTWSIWWMNIIVGIMYQCDTNIDLLKDM